MSSPRTPVPIPAPAVDASTASQDELRALVQSQAAALAELNASNAALTAELQQVRSQLNWFTQQLFGVKSEKRPDPQLLEVQQQLFTPEEPDAPDLPASAEDPVTEVPAHTRRKLRTGDEVNDSGLRFGAQVPVRRIELTSPELSGPDADQYEQVSQRSTYRLAHRPGAYVVLEYVLPVVRRKCDGHMTGIPAPVGVLDHAQVDVSALAAMLVNKFVYHLPLYRQHQQMLDQGITLSRSTQEQWVRRSIALLEPIAAAQRLEILSGSHVKIDETPIKAGRTKTAAGRGTMKSGWFWPMLGREGDVAFFHDGGRGRDALVRVLGERWSGTLQTDGYDVYARYAARLPDCTHALCWAHTRRTFLKAEAAEPQAVGEALHWIRELYVIEGKLRERAASEQEILRARDEHSRPIVDSFFGWVRERIADASLLPRSPLARALNYASEREAGLRVFLVDAWLDLDTNDLERALRVVPMGRRNWLFCSTELGARHVAAIQTLLASCRAHGVNAYTYLVDVLQRINMTRVSDTRLLIPRLWKENFGLDPLRSDLDRTGQ